VTNRPEIVYCVRKPSAKTAAENVEILRKPYGHRKRRTLFSPHQKMLIKIAMMWVFNVFFTSTFVLVGELHLGQTMWQAVACSSGLSATKVDWKFFRIFLETLEIPYSIQFPRPSRSDKRNFPKNIFHFHSGENLKLTRKSEIIEHKTRERQIRLKIQLGVVISLWEKHPREKHGEMGELCFELCVPIRSEKIKSRSLCHKLARINKTPKRENWDFEVKMCWWEISFFTKIPKSFNDISWIMFRRIFFCRPS
jgi:hypothetical protein